MRRNGFFHSLIALSLLACSPADGDQILGSGDTAGSAGTGGNPPSSGGNAGGPTFDSGPLQDVEQLPSCAALTEDIYLIDRDNVLYRYDPTNQTPSALVPVGPLGCKPNGPTPYDMSVARDGVAHVLYGSYGMSTTAYTFRVNIANAACDGFSWVQTGSSEFWMFSMGFVADSPGASTETMYVIDNDVTPSRLGYVDKDTGFIVPMGTLPSQSDFLGTGDGELWGFFPEETPPAILRVDKSTGAIAASIPLPGLTPIGNSSGAYAFAFWGGSFYIFYVIDDIDDSTNVWKVEMDGTLSLHLANTGKRIVGAGVSTCVPVKPPK